MCYVSLSATQLSLQEAGPQQPSESLDGTEGGVQYVRMQASPSRRAPCERTDLSLLSWCGEAGRTEYAHGTVALGDIFRDMSMYICRSPTRLIPSQLAYLKVINMP
jgi:hypothetical protein